MKSKNNEILAEEVIDSLLNQIARLSKDLAIANALLKQEKNKDAE